MESDGCRSADVRPSPVGEASGDDDGNVIEVTSSDAPCCADAKVEPSTVCMSKNALRKLRGQKRLQEAKDRRKALRADAKRRKKNAKREAAANRAKGPLEKPLEDAGLGLRLCVDCDFEELQCESEIYSLVQQLMYAYGDVNRLNRLRDKASGIRRRWKSGWRRECGIQENWGEGTGNSSTSPASASIVASGNQDASPNFHDVQAESTTPLPPTTGSTGSAASSPPASGNPEETAARCHGMPPDHRPSVDFCITGVGPKITSTLKRVQCNGRWKCEVSDLPFEQKFAQECAVGQAVYLTADADEELQTLDPDTVYIVGGIVDRNRYKGLTLRRSKARGVKAAKLPISSMLGRRLEGSKILTVNQVVSVLVAYAELGDWTAALNRVLPPRKGAEEIVEKAESPLEDNILLSA